MNKNPKTTEFLKVSDQFQLGDLLTETPHPKTVGLAEAVNRNIEEAIEMFFQVDREMLEALISKSSLIFNLAESIHKVRSQRGRVFLCGCGATGRLSLVLENIWKRSKPEKEFVEGFMAGGDLALIHSIEKFEDFPDYGARQLNELGFGPNDLLIASTEGGETPWVIGCALEASRLGGACSFLYCNPDELLVSKLKRCQEVFSNENIRKLNFTSGPQALTGSTRLQASSILTAAIGTALFCECDQDEINKYLTQILTCYETLDLKKMVPFIERESLLYKKGFKGSLYYLPSESVAMSVLTDTTERSPTFSLAGFDNKLDGDSDPSWCYLHFPNATNSKEAWLELLKREPRALEWSDVVDKAGIDRLYGFDFSSEVLKWRKEGERKDFSVTYKNDELCFQLEELSLAFSFKGMDLLTVNLILKMILNMHSTLLMGLMGRYQSNIMTFVRPSNNKLIDRCVRYAGLLLEQEGIEYQYENLVNDCLNLMDVQSQSTPIVLEIVKKYLK